MNQDFQNQIYLEVSSDMVATGEKSKKEKHIQNFQSVFTRLFKAQRLLPTAKKLNSEEFIDRITNRDEIYLHHFVHRTQILNKKRMSSLFLWTKKLFLPTFSHIL